MSQSEITPSNIRSLEGDLRDILRDIARSSDTKRSFHNADAALGSLRETIKNLNLAKDALEMSKTLKRREQFYHYYGEAHKCICLTIKHLECRKV